MQPGDRDRLLHDRAPARRRRHGRGVARARRAARARRGDQAAAAASGERRRAPARAAATRRAPPARSTTPTSLTVYDVGEHGGAPYLVTECLEGESLRARLGARRAAARRRPRRRAPDRARARRRPRPRHRAPRSQAGERLPRRRRPREDPRLRPRHAARARLRRAGVTRTGDSRAARDRARPSYMAPEQLRGEARRCAAPTSSRWASCSTRCSPAAGRSSADSTVGHHRAHPDRARRAARPTRTTPSRTACRTWSIAAWRRPRPIASAPPTTPSPPSSRRSWRGCRPARGQPGRARPPAGGRGRPAADALAALAAGAWQWRRAAARLRLGPHRRIGRGAAALSITASMARRISSRAARWPWHLTIRRSSSCGSRCPSRAADHRAGRRRGRHRRLPDEGARLGGARPDAADRGAHAPRPDPHAPVQAGLPDDSKSPAPSRASATGSIPWATVPPGMVRVAGGPLGTTSASPATLDDFWIDRFEVTNEQFQVFVDQGGYRRPELWREPFVDGGACRPVGRGDGAVPRSDRPARTGDVGGRSYPDGPADFPVGGVSWYEAAAYAAFAGRSLPTMHHWYRAAALGPLRRHPRRQQLRRPGTRARRRTAAASARSAPRTWPAT